MHSFTIVAAAAVAVSAFKTSSISTWSENPTALGASIVVTPNTIASKPAIILGLHPCGGTGQMYQAMTPLPSYADKLNLVLLYPTSKSQSGMNCWDAHSKKSLQHDGGGDSQSLAGLVKTAITQYDADPNKIFVVGGSSGAMEANVLAATYPELFKGAASYSGVPAACWAGSPMSTPLSSDLSCPNGAKASQYTAAQWGTIARDCDAGYNGTYPKMMIVHGTADTAVSIKNLKAQLDQWSNVMGLSWAKNTSNTPTTNWKKIEYGDGTQLVGYEVQGGPHIPAFQADATLGFFGLL
ncbi:Alpha/Beta hydrolase protein [Hypomontagnella submonticulosa]|nr:Alpha/Beta hydrolase protein [Hypomontagnella submonticulosa]